MKNFQPSEFRGWHRLMDPKLLLVLDRFRDEWGKPVAVSPAEGAIGRRLNPPNISYHNISKWGLVKAIDVMPDGLRSGSDFRKVFEAAKKAGATGIGLYPDWKPKPGIHLDVRDGALAKWSAFNVSGKQTYFAIEKAFNL